MLMPPRRSCSRDCARGNIDARLVHQCGVARLQPIVHDLAAHTNTRARFESVRFETSCQCPEPRAMIDYGMGHAGLTNPGRDLQPGRKHFMGVVTALSPFRTNGIRNPLSQGSSLSNDERVDLA